MHRGLQRDYCADDQGDGDDVGDVDGDDHDHADCEDHHEIVAVILIT